MARDAFGEARQYSILPARSAVKPVLPVYQLRLFTQLGILHNPQSRVNHFFLLW